MTKDASKHSLSMGKVKLVSCVYCCMSVKESGAVSRKIQESLT